MKAMKANQPEPDSLIRPPYFSFYSGSADSVSSAGDSRPPCLLEEASQCVGGAYSHDSRLVFPSIRKIKVRFAMQRQGLQRDGHDPQT